MSLESITFPQWILYGRSIRSIDRLGRSIEGLSCWLERQILRLAYWIWKVTDIPACSLCLWRLLGSRKLLFHYCNIAIKRPIFNRWDLECSQSQHSTGRQVHLQVIGDCFLFANNMMDSLQTAVWTSLWSLFMIIACMKFRIILHLRALIVHSLYTVNTDCFATVSL